MGAIPSSRTGAAFQRTYDDTWVRDDKKLYFGTDGDVSLSYDATNAIFDVVGATSFLKNQAESSDIMLSDSVDLSVAVRWSKMGSDPITESDVVLDNGTAGQVLGVTLYTDGGSDLVLKPTTSTGWASITFADAGDTATLQYVNDTMGWILVSVYGDTAPPAVSRT